MAKSHKPKSQVKRSQTDRQNAHRSRPRINSAIALLAGYVQKAQSLEKSSTAFNAVMESN